MMGEIDEIKIVKLNKAACPDLNGKLFEMHLELSHSPPPEWCRFFQDAWEETFYHTNRNVQVMDREILIPCTPDELEGELMFYLKTAVNAANKKHSGFIDQRQKRYQELQSLKDDQK
ncbi:MAG: hypothetical protein ACC661_02350, partial [Verrucomicrobiales bacterium]